MKDKTWTKIGLISSICNVVFSLIIHNWYALVAWIVCIFYLVAISGLEKEIHNY